MVKIVVAGILGRMGKRIAALAEKDPELEVAGGTELDPADSTLNIVKDLSEVKGAYDCVIDFTAPAATIANVKSAKELKKAIVIGTTGLSEEEINVIREASKAIPVVFSPNMSVGVNVFFGLIEKTAGILGKNYKTSIKEAHHIHKKDKPSGTAKFMADIVKKTSGDTDVPIEAIRENEIVGEHEIVFESDVDVIKISHSAKTRDIFALGALEAAKFAATKENGLFSMKDVLGLK